MSPKYVEHKSHGGLGFYTWSRLPTRERQCLFLSPLLNTRLEVNLVMLHKHVTKVGFPLDNYLFSYKQTYTFSTHSYLPIILWTTCCDFQCSVGGLDVAQYVKWTELNVSTSDKISSKSYFMCIHYKVTVFSYSHYVTRLL